MKPIISLILPAYNVGGYIEACVNSCEMQDLSQDSYEVIIVNDGSTDDTLLKISNLSERYKNIRILNQQNSGVSVARNNGAKIAKGKYFWFIDPDDIISMNCLATLISIIEQYDLDAFTVGPSIPFLDKFPKTLSLSNNISKIYSGVDYILYSEKFGVAPWCYILKQSFWIYNNFSFYPGIVYEDTQLMPYVLSKAKKVAALTKFSCYNYIQRSGSIMNSTVSKHKLFSNAVIINTHLKYANEALDVRLCRYFEESASRAFISSINRIIQMRADKKLVNDFFSKIIQRPSSLYGRNIFQKLYQYFILHYPYIYIKLHYLLK